MAFTEKRQKIKFKMTVETLSFRLFQEKEKYRRKGLRMRTIIKEIFLYNTMRHNIMGKKNLQISHS